MPRSPIERLVAGHFDLRPAAFRAYVSPHAAIYSPTPADGHFGLTDVALPWERAVGQPAEAVAVCAAI